LCLKQPLFTKNEFVEAYVIFSLFSKFFNSATSIFSTLVMSWSFSNSAATRARMYKFSALYLQWFQSYGQQFIWLLDVKRSRGTAGALYSVHSKRSRGTLLQEQRRHWKASSTYTSSSFTWWFIDGTTNTFSNAHYSQTTHPNWTKPTQGASGNVRISFRNNMGSKKNWNFLSKCPPGRKGYI